MDFLAIALLAENNRLADRSRNGDASITLADFHLLSSPIGDHMHSLGRLELDRRTL